MAEKINNTINSYLGGIQQTAGEKLGNSALAESGAALKARANATHNVTDANNQAQAAKRTAEGHSQEKTGSSTGDFGTQAQGIANQVLGDLQRKV
ncbi:hypothetical protein BGZ49_006398 [Haplosporangium sp. Z 27]|nr:hypothetical protein BGZ49_006398 [Haplosporangium sp. Z 27]